MSDHERTDVTVVVVLYGLLPAESLALQSLRASIGPHAHRFAVEVHDNSPTAAEREDLSVLVGLRAAYYHHPDNPGLAVPYNAALAAAERLGSGWLVLLDQDTTITAEYVQEVADLARDASQPTRVGVAAPRLMESSLLLSPHGPIRLRPRALTPSGPYEASTRWTFLNSGTAIRVSAAREVGGFPEDYPLDFLDHAMAARLRLAGYALRVMNSTLRHSLAVMEMPTVPAHRLRSIYAAENRYFRTSTGMAERAWLFVRRSTRAGLLITGLRRSPNRSIEIGAALEAAWLIWRPRARGPSNRRREQ